MIINRTPGRPPLDFARAQAELSMVGRVGGGGGQMRAGSRVGCEPWRAERGSKRDPEGLLHGYSTLLHEVSSHRPSAS